MTVTKSATSVWTCYAPCMSDTYKLYLFVCSFLFVETSWILQVLSITSMFRCGHLFRSLCTEVIRHSPVESGSPLVVDTSLNIDTVYSVLRFKRGQIYQFSWRETILGISVARNMIVNYRSKELLFEILVCHQHTGRLKPCSQYLYFKKHLMI